MITVKEELFAYKKKTNTKIIKKIDVEKKNRKCYFKISAAQQSPLYYDIWSTMHQIKSNIFNGVLGGG